PAREVGERRLLQREGLSADARVSRSERLGGDRLPARDLDEVDEQAQRNRERERRRRVGGRGERERPIGVGRNTDRDAETVRVLEESGRAARGDGEACVR